jgi:hypothetical protein
MSQVNQPLAPEHINPHHKNRAHTSSQQSRGEIITNIPPRGGGNMSPQSSQEGMFCIQNEQIPTNLQKEEEIMKLVKESENLNLQKEKMHINQREWIAQQWRTLDRGQEIMTPHHQDPLTNSLNELIQEINLNYPQVETHQVMTQKEWTAHPTHYDQDLTWTTSMDRDKEVMTQHISNHQTKEQLIMNPQRLYTSNPIENMNPPRDHQLSMITPPQRGHMTEVPCRNPQAEQQVTSHQFKSPQVEHTNPQFKNPQAEQQVTSHQFKSLQVEHTNPQFKNPQAEQQVTSHQFKSLQVENTKPQSNNPQAEQQVTSHQFKSPQVEHTNPQFKNPQAEHLHNHLPMYNNPQREQAPQRRLLVEHQRDQIRHKAMDLTEAPLTQQQIEQAHVQVSNESVMKHQQENSHDLAAQRGIYQGEEWSLKDSSYLPGPPLTLQDLIS